MLIIIALLFFVFGTVIGSFLNVVIFRFNTHRTFGGHSGCLACQKKLDWYELFPIFSYLALGGRCRGCKTKISIQYPLVEFLTGVFFACLFLKFQNLFFLDTLSFSLTYAFYAVIFSLLLVIAVYDLRHKIIPDILSLVLGVISFIGLFFFSPLGFYPHSPVLIEFLSGPLVALPFALMWLLSRGKWMGFGDAKLALSLGWFWGLGLALSGLVIAFWTGAVVGVFLMIFSRKYGMKSEVPFAPFLVFGSVLAFLLELHIFPLGF